MPEDFLARYPFPLPAPAEQRRIVELLEQADGLRRQRAEADALADRILPAMFEKMFGHPSNHKTDLLSTLVQDFRYGTSNRSEAGGRPTLRIPNIVGAELDLSDLKLVPVGDDEFIRLKLQEGDLLFVRTNGNPDYVGRCAVYEREVVAKSGFPSDGFIFASYLIRARLKAGQANPYFMKSYTSLPRLGRWHCGHGAAHQAGQFNINAVGGWAASDSAAVNH